VINEPIGNPISSNLDSMKPQHVQITSERGSPRSTLECIYENHTCTTTSTTTTSPAQTKSVLPASTNDSSCRKVHFQNAPSSSVTVGVEKEPDSLSSKKNDSSSGRKVRFNRVVRHREVRHLKDYSKEERAAIWNTPVDYQMIRAVIKSTVLMMMKGERVSEDDEDFCTRGLEFRTKAGSKVRSRNKIRSRAAVLNEQELQLDEGFCDPQFLAMASMEESRECKELALLRATNDERCIQEYLDDVRATFRAFR